MGQTLSSPATSKHSESGANAEYVYAVSEMQGWRITMEDAHTTVLSLDEESGDSNTFFAVYDGHGGGTVAKFAGQNVHKRLVTEETYKEKQYEAALKRAFLGTDEDLLANPAHSRDPSGCTAVAALIADNKLYVANAGDSRSVLSIKGEVKPLSFDHKPTNDVERSRISAAGGYIEYGRVNGNLALSRAIGDFDFKKNYSMIPEKQVITADPDVTCHEITDEDEFLILACDGIWDCLSSQQVVDFVRFQVSEGKELTEIGEMMCDHCLAPDTASGAGIGCDNMTIMIVAMLHGRTKEDWYAWITDRVKNEYGYKTPSTVPTLYSAGRMAAFKARLDAQKAREQRNQDNGDNSSGFLSSSGIGGFARVLGSSGGISFHPGGNIVSDSGNLMFGEDDSDESGDEELGSRAFFTETFGLGHDPDSPDPAQALKARLEEFEKDMQEDDTLDDGSTGSEDVSADAPTKSPLHSPDLNAEAPPPPQSLSNGDVSEPAEQFKSAPRGDKPHPAVEADGLMDTSEDPTKV